MSLPIIVSPIKAVISLAFTSLLAAQIIPATPLAGPLDSIGRLTLDTALILAVGVLWRALQTNTATKDAQLAIKDAQIVAMATKVTETMALVMESVKELRKSTEELGAALDNLASNIAALPCSVNERETGRAEKQDLLHRRGQKPA